MIKHTRLALWVVGAALAPPLSVTSSGATPLAPLSPSALEEAPSLETPIREVIVLSDHALVRRVGEVRPTPRGVTARLTDIPASARQVQVSSPRGLISRVETRRVTRLAAPLSDLTRASEALEALKAERARLEARRVAPAAELEWLRQLSPRAFDERRVGAEAPEMTPAALASWRGVRALSQGRQARAQEALDALSDALTALDARLSARVAEAQELLTRASSREVLEVIVSVSGASEPTPITLEYRSPNASWRPRYELHFDLKRSVARRVMLAEVSQQSGEGWPRALLRFSTAAPPEPHERPTLRSWALGEAKDLIPAPRPLEPIARPPRHPPPAEVMGQGEGGQRAIERALQRLNGLLVEASGVIGRGVEGARAGWGQAPPPPSAPHGYPSAPAPAYTPAPAPAPAYAPEYAAAEAAAPEYAPSAPARSRRAEPVSAAPSRAPGGVPSLSTQGAPAQRSSGGLTFAAEVTITAPPPSDPTSPAALADGEEYVFEAPTPTSVQSGGEPLLVPITADESPVTLSYEATPALAPHAYLQGTLAYKGARPLLGGVGALFSGGDYVGEVTLETVRDGGVFSAPLGADTDVRLERRVELKSVVEGFFNAEEVTLYTTTLQVGNYKRRPVRLRVFDVVPVSDHQEVRVEYKGSKPEGVREEGADGVIYWDLDLKAGEVKKVVMSYHIRRPKGWRLMQR